MIWLLPAGLAICVVSFATLGWWFFRNFSLVDVMEEEEEKEEGEETKEDPM